MEGTSDRRSALLEVQGGRDVVDAPPLSPAEVEELRLHVRQITAAIAALLEGRSERIEGAATAHELAAALKPYADRLHSLRRLLIPLERIRDNREHIRDLQAEIAEDVAAVEDVSSSQELAEEGELLVELKSEIAAVKRDRKIFVPDDDLEAADEEREGDGRAALAERPVSERLRLIFGTRFVDLPRLGELLRSPFSDDEQSVAAASLARVWQELFDTPGLRPHVAASRVASLRRAFADFALVYRPAFLPEPRGGSGRVPCSLDALQGVFGDRFIGGKGIWYTRLDFYREPFSADHWALVDRQHLHVTFRKPKIRMMIYARANELAPERVHQKSALEDVYDRAVVDAAVGRQFFSNCNSLTRTAYQQAGQKSKKQVYVYYKDEHIRISGKRGTPHWRPGRPRWPGVLPSVVF